MAVGVSSPAWISLAENGVNLLDDAALPDVSSAAWLMLPAGAVAAFDSLGEPSPDAYSKVGLWGPTHDLAFLNRIHIVPRSRDLGAVISEQEIEVEVWNAYVNRAKVLDEINVTGPAGISVIDHLGVPADFPATQSEIFVVEVDEEGDPQINNVVTWVFLEVDDEGTTLSVVGFRLIPFPFPPNMETPVEETFGYLTDIMSSFSGMEQRVQLRAVPVGTLGYSVFLNERRDAQMAAAILFGNQARAFGVGRWQFRTGLTSAVAGDDTELYLTPDDIPFEVGGLVMLWSSPYVWEVLTIESIESDHLVVTSGAQFSWGVAGTAVVPMVVGRLTNDESLTWESLARLSQTLTFDVDRWRP